MAFPDPDTITVTEQSRIYDETPPTYRTLDFDDATLTNAPLFSTSMSGAVFLSRTYCPEYCGGEGGGGGDPTGPCEDDRPDTGMLYPRG